MKEQTLDEIEGQFLTSFSEGLSVFNASFALSNLLNLNVLLPNSAPQQPAAHRRPLPPHRELQVRGRQAPPLRRHHPQHLPQDHRGLRTQDDRRPRPRLQAREGTTSSTQYSKFKIEALFDEEQVLIEMMEERPEIKKLRDEFIAALPKVLPFPSRSRRPSAVRSTLWCLTSTSAIRSTSRQRLRFRGLPSAPRRSPMRASMWASCVPFPPSYPSPLPSSTGCLRASWPMCTGTIRRRSRRSYRSAGRSSIRAWTTTSARTRPLRSTAVSRSSPTQCSV
jgi:hypothetical protein